MNTNAMKFFAVLAVLNACGSESVASEPAAAAPDAANVDATVAAPDVANVDATVAAPDAANVDATVAAPDVGALDAASVVEASRDAGLSEAGTNDACGSTTTAWYSADMNFEKLPAGNWVCTLPGVTVDKDCLIAGDTASCGSSKCCFTWLVKGDQ